MNVIGMSNDEVSTGKQLNVTLVTPTCVFVFPSEAGKKLIFTYKKCLSIQNKTHVFFACQSEAMSDMLKCLPSERDQTR